MKTALALRHVAFESLDMLGPLLAERGYAVEYVEAPLADLAALDAARPDLLVVLGGPIGVYEDAAYPFLADETALVRARLDAARPTLGICLGAQLMAKALGARVYPSGAKEIGWAPVTLTAAGRASVLAPFCEPDAPVLHWHGDTFDLPAGCALLASTALCPNQAFAAGRHGLALQFHLEVTAKSLEAWFVGHTLEIATTDGISVESLRADTARYAPAFEANGRAALGAWLDSLG